jgi:hypothetical protein
VWADETAPQRPASQGAAPTTPAPSPAAADIPAARQHPLADAVSIKGLANALLNATDDTPISSETLTPKQATDLAKTVATLLSGRDPAEHAAPAAQYSPPPPYRGAPLSGQQPVAAAINIDTPPHEAAERLLSETDGAIARTTLLQAVSLPDDRAQRIDPAAQRWTFEIPFATPQGTSIAQFEVSRDGTRDKADPQARVWRARFSLDVESMGPVHALVTLSGARTNVTLWAERVTTATRLNENAAMLGEALRAAELEPAEFQFRTGAPPVAARQATPGRFMDRAT